MIKILILFIMFFLHVIDDFYMQGIFAQMKQKQWWRENASWDIYGKYDKDYLMALFEHAFSWSFTITIPWLVIAFITKNPVCIVLLIIFYIINTVIHGIIDNEKANKLSINLIQDQALHFIQIILTWAVFTIMMIGVF